MKTYVVVNPASQNGRTGRRWPEMAQRLRAKVGDFEVGFTERPRHASTLVRGALERGSEMVVSVGGDGTHNEVINGFFPGGETINPEAILAVVPTGTGGDLRRTLGLPKDTLESIAYVGERPHRVDAGLLSYTDNEGGTQTASFINITSFGISGLVDQVVNSSSKALGGKLSFLLGTARAALRYDNQPIRFRLDGGEWQRRTINNFAVANGRYFGGGMKVAPEAHMADGLFDVVIIGDLGTTALLKGMRKLYSGSHIGDEGIEVFRAKVVEAEAEGDHEVLIDMDGEQAGRLPARLTVLPGVLRVCLGAEPEIPGA